MLASEPVTATNATMAVIRSTPVLDLVRQRSHPSAQPLSRRTNHIREWYERSSFPRNGRRPGRLRKSDGACGRIPAAGGARLGSYVVSLVQLSVVQRSSHPTFRRIRRIRVEIVARRRPERALPRNLRVGQHRARRVLRGHFPLDRVPAGHTRLGRLSHRARQEPARVPRRMRVPDERRTVRVVRLVAPGLTTDRAPRPARLGP